MASEELKSSSELSSPQLHMAEPFSDPKQNANQPIIPPSSDSVANVIFTFSNGDGTDNQQVSFKKKENEIVNKNDLNSDCRTSGASKMDGETNKCVNDTLMEERRNSSQNDNRVVVGRPQTTPGTDTVESDVHDDIGSMDIVGNRSKINFKGHQVLSSSPTSQSRVDLDYEFNLPNPNGLATDTDKHTVEKGKPLKFTNGLEYNGKRQSQTNTPSIFSKGRGLKLSFPTAMTKSTSEVADLNPHESIGDESFGGNHLKHIHYNVDMSDSESSINYQSGRRSAPVFSRRHRTGLRAFGDRGSDRNAKIIENEARGLPNKRKQCNGKEEQFPVTRSYGSFQTNIIRLDNAKGDKGKERALDAQDGRRITQASRHIINKNSVRQGYWSDCDTDSYVNVLNNQINNSPHKYLDAFGEDPSEYPSDWSLSRESVFDEEDDVQDELSWQNRLTPRFVNGHSSNLPQSVSYSKGKERLGVKGMKSPYVDGETLRHESEKNRGNNDESEEGNDEKAPLLGSPNGSGKPDNSHISSEIKTAVYARRWYILFLFSMYCLVWNAIWSTWGPIAQSAKAVYDWTDASIALFTWLGNIPFLVTMFPIAYLMDVKGMRIAMVFSCSLSFLGAGLRCITDEPEAATWLIDAGQLLNGIAGTVPISGSALVSGLWFPQNQRATATGISTVMGYLGVCFSFLSGPLLVPEPDEYDPANTSDIKQNNLLSSSNFTDLSKQKDGISSLLYFECGAMGVIFLLALLYFPSKPPLPPTVSASMPRESYLKGIKGLLRNQQFWLTAIAFSVPIGVYEVWQIVLDVNLDPKVSQETAGWMDFYSTLGGCAAGLAVSRFADMFTRQIRLFLVVFYTLAAVASLWFTLLAVGILPFDMVSVYTAAVISGVFLDGAAPLFFELIIEVSYPAGEGVTTGFLQMLCAGAGVLFLSLVQIETIGKSWMNWCLVGCITASIPFLFFIRTSLGRADIDGHSSESSSDTDDDEKQPATGKDTGQYV